MSLSQLQKMAGTFEIAGIEKNEFSTELTKIRSKFKQVYQICEKLACTKFNVCVIEAL